MAMSDVGNKHSEQNILNRSFDPTFETIVFQLVAQAADGPDAGSLVYVKAGYNSSTGNYELLTAGSGTTTTTYSYLTLEDGSYLLQESGDKIIL